MLGQSVLGVAFQVVRKIGECFTAQFLSQPVAAIEALLALFHKY